MKPVFADSSYYLALVNARDQGHEKALALSRSILGRIIVTEYVLVELGSAMSGLSDRSSFLATVRQVKADEDTLVVPASKALFRQGLALFESRPDKEWSLVDCISFVVMKQRRIRDALSADHHFEQAGFRALLR